MSFLQADLAQVLLVERHGTAHFPEELREATSLRGLAAQLGLLHSSSCGLASSCCPGLKGTSRMDIRGRSKNEALRIVAG